MVSGVLGSVLAFVDTLYAAFAYTQCFFNTRQQNVKIRS